LIFVGLAVPLVFFVEEKRSVEAVHAFLRTLGRSGCRPVAEEILAHLFLLMSLMMGLALFFLLHLSLETYP
jgi:hypothetical protein